MQVIIGEAGMPADKEDNLFSLIYEILKGEKERVRQEKIGQLFNAIFSMVPKQGEKPSEEFVQTLSKLMPEFTELYEEEMSKKVQPVEKEFVAKSVQRFQQSIRILQKGGPPEIAATGTWFWYGGIVYGVELNEILECSKLIHLWQKEAIAKNRMLTTEVAHAYIEDLISSPRPAPEIPRGFIGAELALSLQPKLETAIDKKVDFSKISRDIMPIIKAWSQGLSSKNYVRQQISRCLDGYKDLVEGDFKRLLNWLAALIRIARGEVVRYKDVKRERVSSKVAEITKSSSTLLVDCYDRRIRNSIAHTDYSFDVKNERIEFHDRKWKKEITLLEFMRLFSKTAMLVDLSLLLINVKDEDLMKKLSKHRDPGWWERVEKGLSLASPE